MAKDKLVKKISEDTGINKGEVSKILSSLFANLSDMFNRCEIKEFKMKGIGTIYPSVTPKSRRYNIKKRVTLESGGNSTLKFRVSRTLQDKMN